MNSKHVTWFGCVCLAAALLWPADASAQRRVIYPARASVVVGFGVGPYYGGLWSPFWYNPFYAGWYPIYPAYPGYAQYGYPYGYGYGYWSAARIEVKPKTAQVYLDGYYVGIVDQFDGIFQRLDVPVGEHDIEVYDRGFHTYREHVLFRPGQTIHLKGTLEPLPPGAPPEPPPQPSPAARQPNGRGAYGPPQYGPPQYGPPQYGPPGPYRQPPQAGPGRMPPPPERGAPAEGDFGTLSIRVQPADAVVVIDGQRWDSPEGGSRLLVQLSSGQHQVEVSKEGYKPYSSTIEVHPGETQNINVSLPSGGGTH